MTPDRRARLMGDGRAAFNRGEHHLAHELWEEVWLAAAGAERRWLQGLIQLAAGLHHLTGGRRGPAARLLARGLAKLEDAPSLLDGVDIEAARAGARLLVAAIGRDEPADARGVST